ncbi:MAG TPA: tol-pal system protein YbgF [Usitatibacter sp.]|nr:tol-pal system protein YbgF [Usitatibacter sp.]
MPAARRLAWAGALAAALAAAIPARAGLFDDDEARRRIDALRKELAQQGKDNEVRIQKLEDTIRNIGVVELVRQNEELQAELARLRGQIEVLNNDNQQLQKRQRDFYLDIDSRLKRLEGVPPSPTTGVPADPGAANTASAAPPPPRTPSKEDQAREVKAYDAASNLFRRNDFASAIEAFRAFVRDFPDSPLAANAGYWIGISYANMHDYKSALAAQEALIAKYPQSPKAPDALLAIAAIQAEQGDVGSARNTLEDVVARYPASEAAGKARTRLASLKR